MEFLTEKYISNFVESQFPRFYEEDGPNFILFVKAYYEWLEETGNPLREARSLFDYRDIDNTLEKFLEYFQKKYLYGIPFNIISNKRFLLKHILDVYRSKGAIQCYRLLFRLIYNEDVEIYLPGNDVLRVSDGNWIRPKYLEITDTPVIGDFVGKTIIGKMSGTSATVESYIQKAYNNDIVNIVYIKNILPNGADFSVGEPLLLISDIDNENISYETPVNLGSLNSLVITSGGQDFRIGDVVKIAHKSPFTDEIISYGKEGLLKVFDVAKSTGVLNFKVQKSGFGYTANALTFVYNNPYDKTGFGGSYKIRSLYAKRSLTYNTDIIAGFISTTLDDLNYEFPGNSPGNLYETLEQTLTYQTNVFGRILSLRGIKVGNNYTLPANTFTRSLIKSIPLAGNVEYSPQSLKLYNIKDNSLTSTSYSNGEVITVLNQRSNVNITDNRTSSPGETHALILSSNNAEFEFYANSLNVSNTNDTIYFFDADTFFSLSDKVLYYVPEGGTAVRGLTGNRNYYINFVNNSHVALTQYPFGANATATITTNSSGGALSFTITNRGSNFITQNPNVVIATTSGIGANLQTSFACAVTGTGTQFTTFLANNDAVYLQANSADANTGETQMIRQVVNNSLLLLYGPTTYTSNANAFYSMTSVIVPASFATYESPMVSEEGINGKNEFISAIPSSGNNTITAVKILDSGIGYVDGEDINAYLYGSVSDTVTIVSGGSGYANNEKLVFAGGNPSSPAAGFVRTGANGVINEVTITYGGSGYEQPPDIFIQTINGKGAFLEAEIAEFNTQIEISGTVQKSGSGIARGYWATTRSFLDSDKYIQDSYYYQDYSYEVRTARVLSEYKDILYNTFHSAGSELFGKYLKTDLNQTLLELVADEQYEANTDPVTLYTIVSETFITCDEDELTVDDYVYDYYQYTNIPTITVDANTVSVVSSNTYILSDYIVVSADISNNASGDINPYLRADSNSSYITSDIIAY